MNYTKQFSHNIYALDFLPIIADAWDAYDTVKNGYFDYYYCVRVKLPYYITLYHFISNYIILYHIISNYILLYLYTFIAFCFNYVIYLNYELMLYTYVIYYRLLCRHRKFIHHVLVYCSLLYLFYIILYFCTYIIHRNALTSTHTCTHAH